MINLNKSYRELDHKRKNPCWKIAKYQTSKRRGSSACWTSPLNRDELSSLSLWPKFYAQVFIIFLLASSRFISGRGKKKKRGGVRCKNVRLITASLRWISSTFLAQLLINILYKARWLPSRGNVNANKSRTNWTRVREIYTRILWIFNFKNAKTSRLPLRLIEALISLPNRFQFLMQRKENGRGNGKPWGGDGRRN